jgi:site-specific DNA-methyltransferase (adenine-specific)
MIVLGYKPQNTLVQCKPILHCVKDKNNYIFNGDDIKIEAKTGAQRKLIDYRKSVPTPYNTEKVPGNA